MDQVRGRRTWVTPCHTCVTPHHSCLWTDHINDHIGEVKENSGSPKDAANSCPNSALSRLWTARYRTTTPRHTCDYNVAQELFLKSSQPLAALEMRKDLKQWDHALKLAKNLKPEELGHIYREYGTLLEMRGDHETALSCYERSIQHDPADHANTQNPPTQRHQSQKGSANIPVAGANRSRGERIFP
eukprot:1196153-Prorocentrum_minimum.AAC.1